MMSVAAMLTDPTLLIGCFTVCLVCWYLFRGRTNANRFPPGPKPWPIVGGLPEMLRRARSGKFQYEIFDDLRREYGDMVRIPVGPFLNVIVVFGQKNYHQAAVELNDKTKFRPRSIRMVQKIFRNKGLILSNGEQHAVLRKFALGAFRDFGVGKRGIEERIQEEAHILCDLMTEKNGNPQDYFITYKKAVSNVIANIVYGSRFEYDDPDFLKAIASIDTLFKGLTLFAPDNFIPFYEKLPFSQMAPVFKAMEYLEGYAKSQIAEHRRTFDPNNIRDFVDLYLQHEGESKGYFTDDNMFRLIVDLFNAGTDTTSLSMSWAVLFLVKNPHVQEKCRKQITEVVGDGELSMSHREKLPYLQAVINEVLRMACIAPQTVPHTILEDVEMSGYIIPKNSIIMFSLHSVLQDPKVWTKPEEFRPERFLTNEGQLAKVNDNFTPFGIGGRSCIGKNLANMELFLFLGTLLQRFEFKSTKDPATLSTRRMHTGITSQPEPYEACAIPVRGAV